MCMGEVPLRLLMERELALRDIATIQLRECNLEAIRASERVNSTQITALSKQLDELRRLVYVGLGLVIALGAIVLPIALEFVLSALKR